MELKNNIWAIGGTPYGESLCKELINQGHSVYFSDLPQKNQLSGTISKWMSVEFQNAKNELAIPDCLVFMDKIFSEQSNNIDVENDLFGPVNYQLTAFLASVQLFAKTLVKNKSKGNILAVCDIVGVPGRYQNLPNSLFSGAVKGFVKSLAKELSAYNIQVNMICYGLIEGVRNMKLSDNQVNILKHFNINGIGTIQNIANAAELFLRKESYINGELLRVDSGAFM